MRKKVVTKKAIEDIISDMKSYAHNTKATPDGLRVVPKGEEFIAAYNTLASFIENSHGEYDTSSIPDNICCNVLRMSNYKIGKLSSLTHSLEKGYNKEICKEMENIMEDIINNITQS